VRALNQKKGRTAAKIKPVKVLSGRGEDQILSKPARPSIAKGIARNSSKPGLLVKDPVRRHENTG
jgi:hypothetical protein